MPAPHAFDLAAIGAGLPVAGARAELEAGARSGAMVVTAPPGTGKTTFVPPLLANLVPGQVLLTQPRRVAVRAAARRIAQLDGTAIGGPSGFTVRGERKVSAATRIESLTPGVLLRRLLADPELEGIGAVILDEVHERSLDTDLLLGMLAEVRALREDLLVVAMSATLDAAAVADLLGGAAVLHVPAPLHPLRIDYAPSAAPRLDARGVTPGFLDHVAEVAVRCQREEGGADGGGAGMSSADALVFLPSARDVDEVVRRVRALAPELEVLPLHGRLSPAEQDRATAGHASGPARIIVATALAESSLTVPGVRLVIDAALSREVRRDQGRDMTGLVTVSASRASIEQRAGRAARQGPGRAVRLCTEADAARMRPSAPPEISAADLTDAALLLAAWGTPWRVDGSGTARSEEVRTDLALLTPPPAASVLQALEVLTALGLTEADGRASALGARVAQLPVGVREARALLETARATADPRGAAEVIAAISDDHRTRGADVPALLRELRSGRAPGAARWRREAERLERIARRELGANRAGEGPGAVGADAAGAVIARARPDWIARRTGAASRSYLLASGTRAALPEGSGLIGSAWLAISEVQRAEGRAADGTGAVIRAAAPLDADDALGIGSALLREERIARVEDGAVRVRAQRRLGAIVLADTPVGAREEDLAPAFAAHLRETGLEALTWSDAAKSLRGRLGLIHRELGAPWPAMDDAALLDRLHEWLGPDLARLRPGGSLRGIDVTTALQRLLPWPEAARLGELAPERLAVPSGGSARIDYPAPDAEDGRPVVAVKLQELFGLSVTPRLVDGRVPVLFHLLSPARRPLAVTDDLESFWNGPYQQVRKEMRGRYPKHPWPEDPWTAVATARVTRGRG
ncbi:ATP-dependent helicase HrpB [Brachybacterium equifaecis]|nr:ATP-dependent helicase HrpB [Brachybacterium equifaecis]